MCSDSPLMGASPCVRQVASRSAGAYGSRWYVGIAGCGVPQRPVQLPGENMQDKQLPAPDNTAVRVALWRALHMEADAPPHVLEDAVGLQLVAPEEGWRSRPDMS